MIVIKSIFSLLLLPLMVSQHIGSMDSFSLHGIVSDKKTGKPLPDIYLYTVKGVEEAITDKHGEFKIVTWQKIPVALYVRSSDTGYVRIIVTNPSTRISVKL